MKRLIIGILAHVDAGKTTLSESLLFLSGKIRRMGRVDNKDAYLDTFALEKARGITIFSKQAVFSMRGTEFVLLDTPGHVDFSAEMERTLQVLDYGVLVISGADGVQGHTKTLWKLLNHYHIPTFIFVNKMDQAGTDKEKLLKEIKETLDDGCILFDDEGQADQGQWHEEIALCDESLMNEYLIHERIDLASIIQSIAKRHIFPVYFGSALKQIGVEDFVNGFIHYTMNKSYPDSFGGKVFKIGRDEQGNRLTYLKITGGRLKVRDVIKTEEWEEKVNQIRVYSGDKYETVGEMTAGGVCAVTGLTLSRPGQGFGSESASLPPVLEPVLSYQMILPTEVDPRVMLPKLRLIEEEEPELGFYWDEGHQEIHVQIMGEVQLEILKSLIMDRFNVDVTYGEGKIVYKETIDGTVEGVGHFEPLRHYAEVHLVLEGGPRGSGLIFSSDCSEDVLDKNWQRLVLTHLKEKEHRGVLVGAALTDMKITLVTGAAHNKHTEGGDFREATYRAVRQGLMQAASVLLEPYYTFLLELPNHLVGRGMMDIEAMEGVCELTHTDGEVAIIKGRAPVSKMKNYQKEVNAYSKGYGRLQVSAGGYDRCGSWEKIVLESGYEPLRDMANPTDSVFCAQGTGFVVPWDQVFDYMHLELTLKETKEHYASSKDEVIYRNHSDETFISLEEIDEIIQSTYYANQGKRNTWKKGKSAKESYYAPQTPVYTGIAQPKGEEYLLVDGYNIIFAWPELKEIAEVNMDGARLRLQDILSNYQGYKKIKVMVVFDAYRVEGQRVHVEEYDGIQVVFTAEAQTADHYIEKFANRNSQKYRITVATSDGLQQIIIRGVGCGLLSARELRDEVLRVNQRMMDEQSKKTVGQRATVELALTEDEKNSIQQMLEKERDKHE